jgi:hypothetical protein
MGSQRSSKAQEKEPIQGLTHPCDSVPNMKPQRSQSPGDGIRPSLGVPIKPKVWHVGPADKSMALVLAVLLTTLLLVGAGSLPQGSKGAREAEVTLASTTDGWIAGKPVVATMSRLAGSPRAPQASKGVSSPLSPRASTPVQLGFVPLAAPVRVCDTRYGEGDIFASGVSSQCDDSGAALSSGSELEVLLPESVVPSSAQAAVVNLTAVDPRAGGYLTVYPSTGSAPSALTSSLNFAAGETIANEITVRVDSAGLDVYFGSAPGALVNVVVDLEGYYLPVTIGQGSPYEPMSPVRIADTRCSAQPAPSFCEWEDLPVANADLPTAGSGSVTDVKVLGVDGVPSDATAVVLNVTETDPTAASYSTVYPSGEPPPVVSDQNWVPGETLAFQAVVGLGTDGYVAIYNAFGNVDLIVDVEGYFMTPGSSGYWFTPEQDPLRLVDTRCAARQVPGFCSEEDLPASNSGLGPLGGGSSILIATSVPAQAVAVALNVADVDPSAANYLAIYPSGGSLPPTSNLNWSPADDTSVLANFDYARIGNGGYLTIYDGQSSGGQADVLVDLYGYFEPRLLPPLEITTTQLPSAQVGASYAASLSASGGTPPYSWTISSGSLPPGLSLSASGGIAGVPESLGTYSFDATVTDSSSPTRQSANQIEQIEVEEPPWNQSPNWSGYVVPSSSLIEEVSGQWRMPVLDCAVTPNSGVGLWVGIGGVSWPTGGTSGALLQTGVSANCVNGIQEDPAWWELYPSNPNQSFDFQGMDVSPGDLIEASVFEGENGEWVTRVDDLTTGISGIMVTGEGWGIYQDGSGGTFTDQGSTVDIYYSGGYTAEWIAEDYRVGGAGGSLVSLADYGTVSFTNLTTSISSWHLSEGDGWEIVQDGQVLSVPSVPSQDGFSVSYEG